MAIKALEDALTIIELIRQRYEAGISEISKELNMNKNKVFRLITTLELKGLVEINEENRKYRLGINFIKLEHSFVKSLNFLETSKPFLRTLKQDVEENVYVSIPQKKDVVYIYEETINKQVIVYSRIAKRFKANKTAAGIVLSKAKKEKGFPVEYLISDNNEIIEIASIIRDEFYYPLAAISIIAPVYRFSEKKLEFSKEKIVSIAEEITETLSPEFSI